MPHSTQKYSPGRPSSVGHTPPRSARSLFSTRVVSRVPSLFSAAPEHLPRHYRGSRLATRKKRSQAPTYAAHASRWYTDLGRDKKGATPSERERVRLQQRFYLDRTVRDLREYFTGFDASDGYDLRYIHRWPAQRVQHVKQYGGYLHHLQGTPYVRVAPKSKRQQKTLRTYTRQNLPRQTRGYVVHVPEPTKTKVKVTDTTVEVSRRVLGSKVRYTIFFFEEIVGYQPVTFEEVQEALREMLEMRLSRDEEILRPDDEGYRARGTTQLLPSGYYTFYTVPNGSIGMPQPREKLLRHAHEYFVRYESTRKRREAHEDFAQLVLGVQYQGTHGQAIADLRVREQQRAAKKERGKLFKKARGKYVTKKRAAAKRRKKTAKRKK